MNYIISSLFIIFITIHSSVNCMESTSQEPENCVGKNGRLFTVEKKVYGNDSLYSLKSDTGLVGVIRYGECRIHDLIIKAEDRKEGLGKFLFKQALNDMQRECKRVTWASLYGATGFYLKQGAKFVDPSRGNLTSMEFEFKKEDTDKN